MNECIFCNIVRGKLPSEKVYENERVLAFLDINPVNPGHTLIIPKDHYTELKDLPVEFLCPIMEVAQLVAKSLPRAVDARGVNIAMNNGTAAGQVVNHAHIHVIPRTENDGLMLWPQKPYKDGEATRIANKLRGALD